MSYPSSEKAINYKHQGKVYPTFGFALRANCTALEKNPHNIQLTQLVRESNILKSAINAPIASAFNQDAYPYFFEKVAALTHHVITGHAFHDGNKRTGLILAEQTLNWNGYYLKASDEALILVILLVASGKLGIEGLRIALLSMCGLDPSTNPHL